MTAQDKNAEEEHARPEYEPDRAIIRGVALLPEHRIVAAGRSGSGPGANPSEDRPPSRAVREPAGDRTKPPRGAHEECRAIGELQSNHLAQRHGEGTRPPSASRQVQRRDQSDPAEQPGDRPLAGPGRRGCGGEQREWGGRQDPVVHRRESPQPSPRPRHHGEIGEPGAHEPDDLDQVDEQDRALGPLAYTETTRDRAARKKAVDNVPPYA